MSCILIAWGSRILQPHRAKVAFRKRVNQQVLWWEDVNFATSLAEDNKVTTERGGMSRGSEWRW